MSNVATKSRKQTAKSTRTGRARRGSGPHSNPKGLLNQITGRFDRSGGRRSSKSSGVASKVSGFVRGFLSGGTSGRRRR